MKPGRKIILSIETAIEGGSIALIEGKDEIDFWTGAGEGLKAEDFIVEISKILDKNKIERKHIKLIAVSNGPGSSTGVKIGLAMARGLGTALNCEVIEVSLLEAILQFANIDANSESYVVFPVGKNLFFLEKVQFVNHNPLKKFEKSKAIIFEKLIEELKLLSNIQIIVSRGMFEIYNNLILDSIDKSNQLIVIKENLAFMASKSQIPAMRLII